MTDDELEAIRTMFEHGVTGTGPHDVSGVTKDEVIDCIPDLLREITDLREHVEALRCHDRECVENRPGWHHWHANGRVIEQELR